MNGRRGADVSPTRRCKSYRSWMFGGWEETLESKSKTVHVEASSFGSNDNEIDSKENSRNRKRRRKEIHFRGVLKVTHMKLKKKVSGNPFKGLTDINITLPFPSFFSTLSV